MKQIYIFIFFSALCMMQNAYAYNHYSFPQSEADYSDIYQEISENIIANCTKAGLLCKTCTELIRCIQIGPGEFMEVHVKTCAGAEHKEYCLIDQCTKDPNPRCTNEGASKFECQNTGVFPDPVDCRIYHICVEQRDLLETGDDSSNPELTTTTTTAALDKRPTYLGVKCDGDYGYNPVTTYCDKKLTNGACPTTPPVPPCNDNNVGQAGPIPGTSIFYVCMDKDGTIAPDLYMCPHGTKFVNGACSGYNLIYRLNENYQVIY